MNLFVVGNGFDRFHELPTDYWRDYRPILESADADLLRALDQFFLGGEESLWSKFENSLSQLLPEGLEPVQADVQSKIDDFQSAHADLHYWDGGVDRDGGMAEAVDEELAVAAGGFPSAEDVESSFPGPDAIRKFLNEGMGELVDTANRRVNEMVKAGTIGDEGDLFVNFNYTHTLEVLYGVDKDRVLHIHGVAGCEVFGGVGRACDETAISSDFHFADGPFENWMFYEFDEVTGSGGLIPSNIEELNQVIAGNDSQRQAVCEAYGDSCQSLLSAVRKVLRVPLLREFVMEMDVECVVVLGHSLGETDWSYFEYLADRYKDARWQISYFPEGDEGARECMRDKVERLGLGNYEVISFAQLRSEYVKPA